MLLKAFEIVALTAWLLAVLSFIANARFGALARIPMQWGLNGQPSWSAPRKPALCFTPILGTLVLSGLAFSIGNTQLGVDAVVLAALPIIAAHLLHLWLVGKSLPR